MRSAILVAVGIVVVVALAVGLTLGIPFWQRPGTDRAALNRTAVPGHARCLARVTDRLPRPRAAMT